MFMTTVIKCHLLSNDILNANMILFNMSKTPTGYDVLVCQVVISQDISNNVIFVLRMS